MAGEGEGITGDSSSGKQNEELKLAVEGTSGKRKRDGDDHSENQQIKVSNVLKLSEDCASETEENGSSDDEDVSVDEDVSEDALNMVECFQISVKTFTQYTISLEVKHSDTVDAVKAKIKEKEGIPVDQQELVFNKKVLDDIDTLAAISIKKESTVTVMRKSRGCMQIVVKINKERSIYVEVKPLDTIGNLKAKIHNKESIPADEQVLIFNEMVAEDSGSIVDFNINNKSTLTLMRKSTGFMQISVNTGEKKTVFVKVKPSETIHEVKGKIQDMEGIPPDEQVLIFNGVVLNNNGILGDLNIKNGSSLTLGRKLSDLMQISVETDTGERETISQTHRHHQQGDPG